MEGGRMCQLTRMKPITTSVRLRRRRGGDQGDNQVRHSADMDYGPPRRSQIRRNINNNNSVEWEDEGFTTEPVKRRNKVTNFHNMSMSRPSMQTLDRRISVSSDQLDTMKKLDGFREKRPSRTRSSSRYLYDRKPEQDDVMFQYKGEMLSKNQYFFGGDGGGESRRNLSREAESKKTPYEMFLEDDGPYSRKLYGPVDGPRTENRHGPREEAGNKRIQAAVSSGNVYGGAEKQIFNNLVDSHREQDNDSEEDDDEEFGDEPNKAVKKGLLWQQRDRLFSRWKERYFVLTRDYIHCFKKASSKITEMGGYIFKVKLIDIDCVDLLDKRGYLTICISQLKDGRIYLRKPEGIRDWFNKIQCNVYESKKRRKFWVTNSGTDSSNIEKWLLTRQKIGAHLMSESTPNMTEASGEEPGGHLQNRVAFKKTQEQPIINNNNTINTPHNQPRGINRLSLVSDLLMNEAVSEYTKSKIEEKTDDSGNDSGLNSMNTTSDSQSDNNSSQEDPDSHIGKKLDTPDIVKETETQHSRYKDSSSFGNNNNNQRKPAFRRSYAFGQVIPVTQV